MERKDIITWGVFAVACLFALYLTFHRKPAGPAGAKGGEDFYRNSLRGFDPEIVRVRPRLLTDNFGITIQTGDEHG